MAAIVEEQDIAQSIEAKKALDETELNAEAGDAEDDDDDEEEDGATGDAEGKKKKKKKKNNKKKKKAGASSSSASLAPTGVPSKVPHCRLLGGNTDYYLKYGQTDPPTRPVAELFPNGKFPQGEILPHNQTKYPDPTSSWARTSEAERR